MLLSAMTKEAVGMLRFDPLLCQFLLCSPEENRPAKVKEFFPSVNVGERGEK